MSEKFGWCFIGCGTLAKKVAKQIIKSGRHTVVSVYSRSFDKCRAFANKYGASAYGSAAQAINADGVDGVYIVTPHASHYEYAKLSLELGKPVFCEKSFTVDAKQAEELAAIAKDRGIYLAEAMWTWFAPVANKVKKWLDCGEFGEIKSVKIKSHLPTLMYAPRVTDPAAAGGTLLDMGVYSVTYLYRLFGTPSEIKCKGDVSKGIDWRNYIELKFPSGLKCSASVSIKDFGFEKLIIEGSKARLKLGFFHSANSVKLIRKNGKNEKFSGYGGYLNEFDIAASEIREGLNESRFVPLKATVDVMQIMDECRNQMNLVYPFE